MNTYAVIFTSGFDRYAYLIAADYEEQAIKEGIIKAQADSRSFMSIETVLIMNVL